MFRSFAIISVLACAALPVCAQDLSGTGADAPRIVLTGVDNAFNLANDIVLI